MRLCQKKSGQKNYWLNGYDKLCGDVRQFMVVCGYAGYVPDGVLNMLLNDDRVLRQLPEIKACMDEELAFLDALPPLVWQRLETFLPDTSEKDEDYFDLRSAVVNSGLIAQGFIRKRVLNRASAALFGLTQGDIEENLEQLIKQSVAPEELISRKIWRLLRSGISAYHSPLS